MHFVCDRCEFTKQTEFTDRFPMGIAPNVEVGGIRYWLCEECETELTNWIMEGKPSEGMGVENA